ncbi:phage baseplate protein [Citrobacter freundii]|uniref:phage baseplate protein n=1 Tax=Citrobacter freundii TaxID=546 RepID=UPI001867DF80|nr:hypothetical protein [Citrobacter freundii]
MPIESAQYINTLQPDWPQGVDPEADGDDHIRMVKQVLQNTFPNMDGGVTATPAELNGITDHMYYSAGDGTAANPPMIATTDANPDGPAPLIVTVNTQDAKGMTALPFQAINWNAVMNVLYPVGSVVMNSNGINPADYMGFGTWAQRAGTIYGVGDCADQNGYNKTITPGAHNADAYWRVQNGHIVAQDMNVTLTMDAVADHVHPITGNTEFGNAGNNVAMANTGSPQTNTTAIGGAGGHTPTGTGAFTLGTGGVADGAQLLQPGVAFYFWERTA